MKYIAVCIIWLIMSILSIFLTTIAPHLFSFLMPMIIAGAVTCLILEN